MMKLRLALWILGGLILLLVAFGMGMLVGYRAASFQAGAGERYFSNFYGAPLGPRPFGPLFFMRGPGSHGEVGKVVSAGTSTLSVVDADGDVTSVLIPSGTPIEKFAATTTFSSIKAGDMVAVIGAPNDAGQVVAQFVRVFPARPPTMTSTSSS